MTVEMWTNIFDWKSSAPSSSRSCRRQQAAKTLTMTLGEREKSFSFKSRDSEYTFFTNKQKKNLFLLHILKLYPIFMQFKQLFWTFEGLVIKTSIALRSQILDRVLVLASESAEEFLPNSYFLYLFIKKIFGQFRCKN